MVVAQRVEGELVPQYDDIRASPSDLFIPGVPSLPDYDPVNIGILFDPDAIETVYFDKEMPHSYKEGSNVTPHIHWEPINTNTGDVYWRLEYKWKNDGESDPIWTTIYMSATGNGEAFKMQRDDFTEIVGTGKKISSIFSMRLSRMGNDAVNDTYDADALLKMFDIHFKMDTRGSVQIASKL